MSHAFAVEANLGCYFRATDRMYSMRFDEDEIMRPVRHLWPRAIRNDFWREVREAVPSHIFRHEFPMGFDVRVDTFDSHPTRE